MFLMQVFEIYWYGSFKSQSLLSLLFTNDHKCLALCLAYSSCSMSMCWLYWITKYMPLHMKKEVKRVLKFQKQKSLPHELLVAFMWVSCGSFQIHFPSQLPLRKMWHSAVPFKTFPSAWWVDWDESIPVRMLRMIISLIYILLIFSSPC